ncbi:hypothetical protein L1887_61839 [Cichorium endivia]|nr:hypothetical protein L1887_61839 [Cichorium endivia]
MQCELISAAASEPGLRFRAPSAFSVAGPRLHGLVRSATARRDRQPEKALVQFLSKRLEAAISQSIKKGLLDTPLSQFESASHLAPRRSWLRRYHTSSRAL